MRISVLIENSTQDELVCEHGLSFLIHFHDKVYLLDAGQTGAFIENARALNIDLSCVDKCILSHGHYDHSDGFIRFLELYPHHQIWACDSVFDEYYSSSNDNMHYIGLDKRIKKDYFHLINQVTCIDEGVYLIPHHATQYTVNKNLYRKVNNEFVLDDFQHELSLVFVDQQELVILNSCSHVGMLSVIEQLPDDLKQMKIKAYLGGLHMKGRKQGQEICVYSDEDMQSVAHVINKEKMNVFTGHCTGEIAFDKLKMLCKNHIIKLYSGLCIEL